MQQSTDLLTKLKNGCRTLWESLPSWQSIKRFFLKGLVAAGVWFLQFTNKKDYQIVCNIRTIIDKSFKKLQETQETYTSRYNWELLRDELKFDLIYFLSSLKVTEASLIADWLAEVNDDGMEEISSRISCIFAEEMLKNKESNPQALIARLRADAPDTWGTLSSEIGTFTEQMLNMMRSFLDKSKNAPPIELLRKWWHIFKPKGGVPNERVGEVTLLGYRRLAQAMTPADSAAFYEHENGSRVFVKPLRTPNQTVDAAIEVIIANLAEMLGLQNLVAACDLEITPNVLVLKSACLGDFEPLVDQNKRLSVRILSETERRELRTSLNAIESAQLEKILAFSALVGDYDCHAGNIGRVGRGKLYKIDHAWGLDGIANREMPALDAALNPSRYQGRIAPTNSLRDYQSFIAKASFRNTATKLAQDIAADIPRLTENISKSIAKIKAVIHASCIDEQQLCLALGQRIGVANCLSLDQLATELAAALQRRTQQLQQYCNSPPVVTPLFDLARRGATQFATNLLTGVANQAIAFAEQDAGEQLVFNFIRGALTNPKTPHHGAAAEHAPSAEPATSSMPTMGASRQN